MYSVGSTDAAGRLFLFHLPLSEFVVAELESLLEVLELFLFLLRSMMEPEVQLLGMLVAVFRAVASKSSSNNLEDLRAKNRRH